MNKIKKILLLIGFSLFLILILFSCEKPKYNNYNYKTTIEIKFYDNTVDTIVDVRKNVYYKKKIDYKLKQTKKTGVPCLSCVDPYYELSKVGCYVKTFKILKQTKKGVGTPNY